MRFISDFSLVSRDTDTRMSIMTTTVFHSGGSQAVRIPKEFRFDAKRVEIESKGATLIPSPIPDENGWPEGYPGSFAGGRIDDTFVRPDPGESREIHF